MDDITFYYASNSLMNSRLAIVKPIDLKGAMQLTDNDDDNDGSNCNNGSDVWSHLQEEMLVQNDYGDSWRIIRMRPEAVCIVSRLIIWHTVWAGIPFRILRDKYMDDFDATGLYLLGEPVRKVLYPGLLAHLVTFK